MAARERHESLPFTDSLPWWISPFLKVPENTCFERRQEAGGRRQEAGGRRQETGDRRQETGDRKQGVGRRGEGDNFTPQNAGMQAFSARKVKMATVFVKLKAVGGLRSGGCGKVSLLPAV
jgi:hypothetical protein